MRRTAPTKQAAETTGPTAATAATTYGYARVSTDGQTTEMQVEELRRAGCDSVVTDDGWSGKNMERPGWQKLFAQMRAGDTLVVWKLDRVGRSLVNLVNTLADLDKRGIGFRSLHDSIDTKTPAGRLQMQMLAAFAEYEHAMIAERTRAGQRRAQADGIKFGRPSALSGDQLAEAKRLKGEGRTNRQIAGLFGVGFSTLTRAIREV